MHASNFRQFSNIDVSQGSAATRLRCGGIINDYFAAYSLTNLTVNKFGKLFNSWRSYGQYYSGLLFWLTMYIGLYMFKGSCPPNGLFPGAKIFAIWSTEFNRGRHLYSAGRPSRWASSHILVTYITAAADGDHTPLPQKGDTAPPNFWPMSHVCCGQTAGWIKMTLGTEVGLGPGDIVLHWDPAPPKGAQPPIFGPCLL